MICRIRHYGSANRLDRVYGLSEKLSILQKIDAQTTKSNPENYYVIILIRIFCIFVTEFRTVNRHSFHNK